MKKITIQLTFLLFVFISLVGYAQVNIGDGVEVNKRIPIEPFYGYTYSQVIYLQSEIETAMDIGHLIYNATPATTLEDSNQWTVYMGHTTKTQFDSDTDWINLTELTEVYSGTVTISSGAVHILLDTNFSYNGTDNLVIAVDENQSGYDSSTHDFYTTAVTNNRSISYWSDSTNPEPASPPTAGTVQAFIANITLDTTPTCSWVTDLDVNDIGSFSSTVTWTENGSASSWNLEYGEAGFELGTGTTAIADTTTFELTGLSSDTPYDVYVQADCDGDGLSSWTGPVTFQTLISCPSPTELSVSDITETSVNLSWIENGTATTWNIEYGTSGFVLGEGTLESITDNPYTLSGLSDSTTYDYYVQADCGDGDSSSWTGPFTFQTSIVAGTCGIYKVELIDSFGDGWNGGMIDIYINGELFQNITLESGYGPELTQISVDIEDVLSFVYTAGSWSTENEYKIYDQLDTLVVDEGIDGTPNNTGDPTIPTGITACPSCPSPTDFVVSDIAPFTATASWTEYGSATSWNVEYGETGFELGTGTNIVADATTYELIDLSSDTTYDIYVQADCGDGDQSTWTGPVTFQTLISCPSPTELSVSDITETSANLSWIENGTATTWNIEYGTSGFVLGEGTLESITDNPYTLSGLSDSTTYDYYVQADCGDGDSSSWTGPFTFQTSVVAGTCGIYTVELIDSFGDGWNGGMLDLYINGDLYQNVTLESGTGPEVTEVPVDIEDVLSIIYTSGSWASENEYKVYDQLGNLIFDEGASGEPNSIGDPTIPTGITACPTCPTPIELSVSEVGAYSVVLNWTEIGEATTWNIEYGPVGFTIGSGTALVADTNPFTLTDLVPNTNYDCYIQADCAGDDLSTWSSVITWLTLPIPPENNDCENASILPLDGTLLTATNFASSASGELPEPSCGGFGDGQDVWYVVTATELSNITISTEEFPGSELDDTVVSLYSGVCGDFEEIACNDDYLGSFSTVTAYGIEAGETIYIRVHEFNNDTFDTFYISATYVSAASVNDTLIDGFTMYPNPVGNILHIKANVSIDQVNISDMLGRNLIKSDTSALDMEINMSHLPIGTYLVEVTSGNNTETYKLIKE